MADELITIESLQLFGLTRQSSAGNYDPQNDKAMINSQGALTRMLVSLVEVTVG